MFTNPTARSAGKSTTKPRGETSSCNKAVTPIQKGVPASKRDFQVFPLTPILATRPKQVLRPLLKDRENLGLAL